MTDETSSLQKVDLSEKRQTQTVSNWMEINRSLHATLVHWRQREDELHSQSVAASDRATQRDVFKAGLGFSAGNGGVGCGGGGGGGCQTDWRWASFESEETASVSVWRKTAKVRDDRRTSGQWRTRETCQLQVKVSVFQACEWRVCFFLSFFLFLFFSFRCFKSLNDFSVCVFSVFQACEWCLCVCFGGGGERGKAGEEGCMLGEEFELDQTPSSITPLPPPPAPASEFISLLCISFCWSSRDVMLEEACTSSSVSC